MDGSTTPIDAIGGALMATAAAPEAIATTGSVAVEAVAAVPNSTVTAVDKLSIDGPGPVQPTPDDLFADNRSKDKLEVDKKPEVINAPERTSTQMNELARTTQILMNLSTDAARAEVSVLLTPAEQIAFLKANPGKNALIMNRWVATLGDHDFTGKAGINLRGADGKPKYTVEGNNITRIIKSADGKVTCEVDGSTTPIVIEQGYLAVIMMQTDRDLVASNFKGDDQDLMNRFLTAQAANGELSEDVQIGLPELIVKVAEANGIATTGTLLRAGEKFCKAQDIPDGTDPVEAARITADNTQRAARLEELKQQLAGRSLATAEDIQGVMELIGLDQKGITDKLVRAREDIQLLEKALGAASDSATQERLKTQLDTARATTEVYEVVQNRYKETTVAEYVTSQQAGAVSTDLGRQISKAIEENNIEALVLMISPEASVNVTATQKAEARRKREEYNKKLKTVGTIAALAALLVALGISQGAKG